jgi:hypothetical protein
MLSSLRWFLAGTAVLSLIGLIAVAVIYWLGIVVSDTFRYRRAEFPQEVPLGETVCSGWSPGLTEGSWIAVYGLDSESSARLVKEGFNLLNGTVPPPTDRGWLWTPWMEVETGADVLRPEDRGASEGIASRAKMFVVRADGFTHSDCKETIRDLDWEGALVRFKYPPSWTVDQCVDSCLAQVVFPASGLAISATFD